MHLNRVCERVLAVPEGYASRTHSVSQLSLWRDLFHEITLLPRYFYSYRYEDRLYIGITSSAAMPWLLLDTDSDLLVEIPVSELLPETVRAQWERFSDEASRASFAQKLGARLESALIECLDTDLKPPSSAQVAYAIAISKKLGVMAPEVTFKYRGAMSDFLTEHAPVFKTQLTHQPKKGGTRRKTARSL